MLRSFISKCFLYGTAFHLWSTFVLVRFDDDTDDQNTPAVTNPGETASHDPRENTVTTGKKDKDAIFIPLSWSRLQKGELYATTDPEWQAFVKLSKDKEKLQALRGEQ
ncbi:uncharacterized protein N7529_004413 [Penicillium soppii]|jgi:hypothetical protein|uniref:uncharacterized protein n=1 Tax=Penicillium soppii TaxID=69789 RepID=UPI0025468688|nr:uncharacterized protein N7529_004413 [Penicillium soppii]KAJ5872060.1 hypothetical protein N7529_004413 [Penicillium soppii]